VDEANKQQSNGRAKTDSHGDGIPSDLRLGKSSSQDHTSQQLLIPAVGPNLSPKRLGHLPEKSRKARPDRDPWQGAKLLRNVLKRKATLRSLSGSSVGEGWGMGGWDLRLCWLGTYLCLLTCPVIQFIS
jgi:hypothetical protein